MSELVPEQAFKPQGLSIRRARSEDHEAIHALLRPLELAYPGVDLSCFWVVECAGALVAAAELKETDAWSLLSCVGVRKDLQRGGIGRALVETLCRQAQSPVYLYTLVPEFFRKAGFRDAVLLSEGLPPRTIYDCSNCTPSLCRCLVRPRDAS
jgi:N-acetylglutamate synthase-like GNAT family acetyltransferase